jgi:hypothetical protein
MAEADKGEACFARLQGERSGWPCEGLDAIEGDVDLERSDFVIANLWKESIGTVLGIVQAANAGKPVILVDPNYLNSHALLDIVGANNVVHTLDAAMQVLEREVVPMLEMDVQVIKRKGTLEPFKRKKLQNKLNACCTDLGIEGSPLPVIVSHRVQSRIRTASGASGKIDASRIVEFVFEELAKVVTETDGRYKQELEDHATRLKDEWGHQNQIKDDRRALEELSRKELEIRTELRRVIDENRALRAHMETIKASGQVGLPFQSGFSTVSEAVKAAAISFTDVLVFDDGEKAFRSAEECPFNRPDEVYTALDLLAQYADFRRTNHPSTGARIRPTGLKEWLKEKGSPTEYASSESKSTRSNGKLLKERTVQYRGKPVEVLKYLKIGAGNANEGSRIHFELLSEAEDFKILIGHVGRHLSLS